MVLTPVMAKLKWDEVNCQLWRTMYIWQVTATTIASFVNLIQSFPKGVRCGHTLMGAHLPTVRPLMVTALRSAVDGWAPPRAHPRYVGRLWPWAARWRKTVFPGKREFLRFFIVPEKINSLILYICQTSTPPCRGCSWCLSFGTYSLGQLRMCVFPPKLGEYVDWLLDWWIQWLINDLLSLLWCARHQ